MKKIISLLCLCACFVCASPFVKKYEDKDIIIIDAAATDGSNLSTNFAENAGLVEQGGTATNMTVSGTFSGDGSGLTGIQVTTNTALITQMVTDATNEIPSGAAVYNQTKGFDYIYTDIGSLTGLAYTYNPVLYGLWKEYDVLADGQIFNDKMVDFSINQDDPTIISPAALFNGLGDYCVGTSSIFITNKTISAWVNLQDGSDGVVWSFGAAGGRLFVLSGSFRVSGIGPTSVSVAPYVGSWHFYEVDVNQDGEVVEFRIDGDTKWTGVSESGSTSGIWSVGARDDAGFDLFKNMSITDFSVSGSSLKVPFTEGAGLTAYDVSGNGNHGTIANVSGTVWDGTQTNSPYAAEYGASKVMSFDGTSSRAEATATGAGSADFYYRYIGSVEKSNPSSPIFVFSDGDGSVEGKRVSVGTGFANGDLQINLDAAADGGQTQISMVPPSEYDTGDFFDITLSRDGSALSASFDNLTKGLSYTTNVTAASSYYSSGQRLSLGAIWSGSSYVFKSEINASYFCVGTSATNKLLEYRASDVYRELLSDIIGTNDATLVNVDLVNIPALLTGTDDAAGLGITNPKGLAHNNGGYSLSNSVIGAVTYADLVTNTVWTTTLGTNDLIETFYK